MKKKDTFNTQFKAGYYPVEGASEVGDWRDPSPPMTRSRMGIQIGSASEARPGLAARTDRNIGPSGTKRKASKRGR